MPKRDEIGRETEKKNLVPNSVHTRPGQENFEKNRKKNQKIKNLFPELVPSKTGVDRLKKREKKNLVPISVQTWLGEENSEKKSKKIQKIEKPLSDINFSQNGMR